MTADVFGLDPQTLARARAIAGPLYRYYFRVAACGAAIPASGPTLLVANHGGILPVDAALLCLDAWHRSGRVARPIVDHFVGALPFVGTLFARCGAVNGSRANVAHLLDRGELVPVWPEGVSGPAKPFRERYRLQAWNPGFAELAIRHRALVMPVAIVGAEEAWPLLATLGRGWFGHAYLPVPRVPLPLPLRVSIAYGAPRLLGARASDADDPVKVAEAASEIRHALAALLPRRDA